jgi:hydroxymethylbilane synthase
MTATLRLGTRGSALALAQSRMIAAQLESMGWAVQLQVIKTTGDRITEMPLSRIGVKGLFVSELEQALLDGSIDLAVHSMKDLPGEMPPELCLAAVPPREDPRDVLVGRTAPTLAGLRPGALLGTSSLRRRAQLLAARGDLGVADLRGNLDTRLRKLDEGQYDAICLAAAGLHRLGLRDRITAYIDTDAMVPAPGQGALALQTRADDLRVREAVGALNDPATARATHAERTVLAALGGGCSVPLGALAVPLDGDVLTLTAVLAAPEGAPLWRVAVSGDNPEMLGRDAARALWDAGASGIEGLHAPA